MRPATKDRNMLRARVGAFISRIYVLTGFKEPPIGEPERLGHVDGQARSSWLDSPRWTVIAVTCALMFGATVSGTWVALAQLNRGTIALGRIQTSDKRTLVQHLDGGTVERILVKQGQEVRPGQLLITLDARPAAVSVEMVEKQQRLLLIEQTILRAEVEGVPLRWPTEVTTHAADGETRDAISIHLTARAAGAAVLAAKKAELAQQVRALGEHANGVEAQRVGVREQIRLTEAEQAMVLSLVDRNLIPKMRLLAIQRAAADLNAKLGNLDASLVQDRVQMHQKALVARQLDAGDRSEDARRLQQLHGKLTELNDRIRDRRLVLARTEIRAPGSGVVLRVAPTASGSVIRPGESVIELVPSDELLVSAVARPRDIDRIFVGARAAVKLSGLNAQTAPRLRGRVVYVSADQLADTDGKLIGFEVRVAVPRSEQVRLGRVALKAGMPAEVMIDAGARTTLAYLVQPIRTAFDRAFRE